MLTTGFLSLNVHDSLTFDGAELCLHPDLFAHHANNVSGADTATRSSHGRTSSTIKATASIDDLGTSVASGTTATASQSPVLSVGDMIEIRVWDPMPREKLSSRASVGGGLTTTLPNAPEASSFMRMAHRRSAPPTPSTGGVHVEFPTPSGPAQPSLQGTASQNPQSTTSLRPRASSLATNSLQYSEGSEPETKNVTNMDAASDDASTTASSLDNRSQEKDAETTSIGGFSGDRSDVTQIAATPQHSPQALFSNPTPPTKTVEATIQHPLASSSSLLPPVFPRSRANTSDHAPAQTPSTTTNQKPPMPSTIHRRVTSAAGMLPSQPPPRSPKFTRHMRDLSDMTMETHQLDIINMQQTFDHQDDDQPLGSSSSHAPTSTSVNIQHFHYDNDDFNQTHQLRLSFVLLVTERTLTSLKGNARTQVSLLRPVADLYALSSYDTVTIHKIDAHDEPEVLQMVSADFVVVTIKDQFISRGDMHLFQETLLGSWIYEGERLGDGGARGIKAHAKEIRHGNRLAKSGIVTSETMITFRSRSSRITWLVQLSSEMWEYASPYERPNGQMPVCEIYFDQWIRFLYKLFAKWKELEVTHSLTVVFFSRTFIASGKSNLNCRDVYGRCYEDHYKPIIENTTCTDWESLVTRIKEEFVKYPKEVGWDLTDRRPSNAGQGNVLEAINVTLNILQYHFLDRDLQRTGNSIVVISSGCGVFEVDKGLASITYQRMMDNGIGSDMLSLGLPPLHIVPFFLYNNEFRSVEAKGVDASETYYEVPHWMHLSFVSYDRDDNTPIGGEIKKGEEAPDRAASAVTRGTNVARKQLLDLYEIGPNGFLRPKLDSTNAPVTVTARADPTNCLKVVHDPGATPKSVSGAKSPTYSAIGNAAATPGKSKSKVQQERQLISGRAFRDILDACRPRMSGVRMPSPLEALIKIYDSDQDLQGKPEDWPKYPRQDDDDAKDYPKQHLPLREWGTVNFDEITLISRSVRSDSQTARKSPSESFENKSDGSESISSSFASQISLSMFGMSYDRVLWDHESPVGGKSTIQLQRPPSLEFDEIINAPNFESETIISDDTMTLASDIMSRSSAGRPSSNRGGGSTSGDEAVSGVSSVGCDNNTSASVASKREEEIEFIKQFTKAFDRQVCAPMRSQLDAPSEVPIPIGFVRPEGNPAASVAEVTMITRAGSRQQNMGRLSDMGPGQSGGLGAALSQYSSTVDSDTRTSQHDPQRRTTPSRLNSNHLAVQAPSGNMSSFQQERNRAASPLLPAMVSHLSDRSLLAVSPLLIPPTSQQLGLSLSPDAPMNFRPNEQPSKSAHRRVPVEPRGHQLREGSSSYGLLSSSYEYGGGILSTGSYTQDASRHRIRQISRSPPSFGANRAPRWPGAQSPPNPGGSIVGREKSGQKHISREISNVTSNSSGHQRSSLGSRRKKACNPFRQSDEDEVLAKRSHNRRRWSHVFPAGEVEFKRHSGPIWNSLTAPAILPLSVDYFPTPQELRDENTFQFNPYTVTLGGMEKKQYSTHTELLMEMVRQRVSQDFQIVTASAIRESENRAESQRQARGAGKNRTTRGHHRDLYVPSLPTIKHDIHGTIKHYLSMGHRIQVLSYDPSSDTIEIVHYSKKSAHNDPMNIYTYKFLLYSQANEKYEHSIQTFKKYSEPYKWNRLDNLILGEDDRTMDEEMRFRRVMFGLIPPSFEGSSTEEDYVSKFKRLIEYLGRLREKEESEFDLGVKIVTSEGEIKAGDDGDLMQVRRSTSDSMIRFIVQLKKGKRDPFEWMEIAIDSTFNCAGSYRILFNWLVASSTKVEAQVQLLHRRCTQFGLQLISFPQTTVSRNLFIHAFAVPTLFCIRDDKKAKLVHEILTSRDFIQDGIQFTDAQVLVECLGRGEAFDFPKYRSGRLRPIPSKQYVHRSGAVFMRCIQDRQGWAILAAIENYRHASEENGFREIAKKLTREISNLVAELSKDTASSEKDPIQVNEAPRSSRGIDRAETTGSTNIAPSELSRSL